MHRVSMWLDPCGPVTTECHDIDRTHCRPVARWSGDGPVQCPRDHAVLPGSDRSRERHARRFPAGLCGAGAGPGQRGGSAAGGRADLESLGWRTGRREGRAVHGGGAHHLQFTHAGRVRAPLRCDGGAETAGRRPGADRQDEHGRVRHGGLDGKRGPGGDSQPVGSRACAGRFQRRVRRRGGGPDGALAIGTDTGGSIRQPAAYCGIVGLKPTYGRVSRFGLVAFASSLDQVGPMARTAEDAALLLEIIAGADPRDATCARFPFPPSRDIGG